MWWFLLSMLILGVVYGYVAAHNVAVMLVLWAGHVWFGKPKEPLYQRVFHVIWFFLGSVSSILFISYAFLEGFRLGS